MARIRKDVWAEGEGWSQTLIWYAKGVRELQSRKITDPTSWRFLGAMHGIWPELWQSFGLLAAGEALPTPAVQAAYWNQCQHQSWYFLPWHRGYLAAFEDIMRAAITKVGGPGATWALPYWNYNNPARPNALRLHPAFLALKMPDGTDNPLFVKRRYGKKVLAATDVSYAALKDDGFKGGDDDVPPGFGGPQTAFHNGPEDDGMNGGLESQPHNAVHGLLGGRIPGSDANDAKNYGLMGMPITAALDPIFWLHHANIDRLWEVWRKRNPAHVNPKLKTWREGPADRKFVMPTRTGGEWKFVAKDVLSTTAAHLGYTYSETSDPFAGAPQPMQRLQRLGATPAAAAAFAGTEPAVAKQTSEMIGASGAPVSLEAGPVDARVRLDPDARAKVVASLAAASAAAPTQTPDRVFLKLENVRSVDDAAVFYVYVGLPPGADPAAHPERLAGTLSLFGVEKATRADGGHGGNGISQVLEITDIVDDLHLQSGFDLDHLTVRFVPQTEVAKDTPITVGRISVHRLGA